MGLAAGRWRWNEKGRGMWALQLGGGGGMKKVVELASEQWRISS